MRTSQPVPIDDSKSALNARPQLAIGVPPPQLTSFSFVNVGSYSEMGTEGAAALAAALPHLKNLKKLDLRCTAMACKTQRDHSALHGIVTSDSPSVSYSGMHGASGLTPCSHPAMTLALRSCCIVRHTVTPA